MTYGFVPFEIEDKADGKNTPHSLPFAWARFGKLPFGWGMLGSNEWWEAVPDP